MILPHLERTNGTVYVAVPYTDHIYAAVRLIIDGSSRMIKDVPESMGHFKSQARQQGQETKKDCQEEYDASIWNIIIHSSSFQNLA